MPSSAFTPLEHALIARAYAIANGTIPEGVAVAPELDCLAQALDETCRHFGMSSDDAARFLLSLARGLNRLKPDVDQRLELRRVERQVQAILHPMEVDSEAG